jgi:hypothetical protein
MPRVAFINSWAWRSLESMKSTTTSGAKFRNSRDVICEFLSVTHDVLNVVRERGRGQSAVKDGDVMALPDELAGHMGTHKSSAANEQRPHAITLSA